jgi:hypothetical protein
MIIQFLWAKLFAGTKKIIYIFHEQQRTVLDTSDVHFSHIHKTTREERHHISKHE